MADLRALLFDVFGTVVDWRGSLLAEATAAGARSQVAADWDAVVDDWRRAYQPALDRVAGSGSWHDLDEVHRGTLAETLARHGVDLPAGEREALVAGWRRLRPWPDARDGLVRLRRRHRTATLSNGHIALLVDLLRAGDLRFDAVLSAQLADSYKPDPRTYLRATELLGCAPDEVGMVAAHAADLRAAADLGLHPLFVRRPDEWGPGGGEDPPEGLPGLVVADDLRDLAARLGC